MGSITIADLIGAANVRDWGAIGNDAGDEGPAFNACLRAVAQRATPNGVVYVPPGTYRIATSVSVPSNITLLGAGAQSILKVYPNLLATAPDVLVLSGVSNVRIQDLVIDGNRANNAGGTRHGVYMNDCQDCWLEDVVARNAAYHGFRLEQCDRTHLRGCVAKNCGYDGISLDNCFYTQLVGCRALDNSKSGAGNGNGVSIGLLSTNTMISDIESRETSGSGTYQGWGVREVPAQNVGLTLVAGYSMAGNVSGVTSFESADSGRWPT